MILLAADIEIAARTVWGEARGEDHFGRRCVAHVFFNRLRRTTGQFRKDDTLASACLRHVQFSTWNMKDMNFTQMHKVDYGSRTFRDCVIAVLEVANGAEDPTGFATHYHADYVHPDWASGHTPSLVHGHHKFYNTVD